MIRFILFLFAWNITFSQSVGDFGNENMMMGDLDSKLKKQEMSKFESVPSTGFVDNKIYYLGPGDVLFLKSLPSLPDGEFLTVSPDGFITLPRSYGSIDIKNINLEEVEKQIKEKIKGNNITLTLYKSKICTVEIVGDVLNSKIYSLPGTYRVSDLYKIANYVSDQSTNEVTQLKSLNKFRQDTRFNKDNELNENRNFIKERNIKILKSDGTIINADLVKSLSKENSHLNPYLMPGDKIIVSDHNYNFNTFQIRGAVINETVVIHKEGDKLSDLIKVASGLTHSADLENVNLYSANNQITKISLNESLEVLGDDPELTPNSILIVGEKSIEKTTTTGVVNIMGEVKKPGAVVIKNGVTKISEVIEMAGGLKETAYLPLARVKTSQNDENSDFWELYRQDIYFQYSDLSVDDTLRLNIDSKIRTPYLAIDFENALNGGNDDVALNDGDNIIIPKNPMRVYVFGKVFNPGYIEFKEGKSFKWYLDKVGGALPSADSKRIRIIRANNFTWVEPEDHTVIYAGDMIYVPSYPEISEQAEIQKWATYTSIGVSIVNVILFIVVNIINLNRN